MHEIPSIRSGSRCENVTNVIKRKKEKLQKITSGKAITLDENDSSHIFHLA